MNEDEKYLFDINGYVVVEQVLTPDEVALCNVAIDHHADQINERTGDLSLSGDSKTLKGSSGRGDMGGMLDWEKPFCDPFHDMLVHSRIVPYLNTILGHGFRMDHCPSLITMEAGAEGHRFHGSAGPGFDPNCYYICKNGEIHCGLTVVAWQFSDTNLGDGGLCLIPGSHKGNFSCPPAMRKYERYQEFIKQVTCKAGDVVIFTEALTHGTLPWKAKHQRRSLLYRYTAGNLAYAPGYETWATRFGELKEDQRAVLEPPYNPLLNRPQLDDEGNKVTT